MIQKNDINFKDKNIEVEVTEDTGSVVNENIFNRVIINVLNNSVLHADHIKILIEINSQLILVSIHDNGPGIPDHEKESVFKPFYRIDKSRNQKKSSVGLGLSIASDIIRSHGGNIELGESEMGGLKIKIFLPV